MSLIEIALAFLCAQLIISVSKELSKTEKYTPPDNTGQVLHSGKLLIKSGQPSRHAFGGDIILKAGAVDKVTLQAGKTPSRNNNKQGNL